MIEFDTVAIPVVKGIDVNTRERLVPAQFLLEAINTRFSRGAGAEKRRGHTSRRVRGSTPLPINVDLPLMTAPLPVENYFTGDRQLPANWVFGWGPLTPNLHAAAAPYETSPHPDAGILFGSASRDAETMVWNGHQLFSHTPGQAAGRPFSTIATPAVLPVLKAEPTAKAATAQTQPDLADNGVIRIVAWVSGTKFAYTVLDSVTGAVLLPSTTVTFDSQIYSVRCIPVGEWIHIVYSAGPSNVLRLRSIHQSSPLANSERSLGPCAKYFDVHKRSENAWAIARNTGSQISVSWLEADGTGSTQYNGFDAELGFTFSALSTVAFAMNPRTDFMVLVYRGTVGGVNGVYASTYDQNSNPTGVTAALGTVTALERAVTVGAHWLFGPDDYDFWDAYWDDYAGGVSSVSRCRFDGSTLLVIVKKFHLSLASAAFRVGDRTFVWAGRKSPLQSSWFLLDDGLSPVGHMDYVTANVLDPSGTPYLCSMNWSGAAPIKDVCVFHGALGYRVRVPSEVKTAGLNLSAIYAEPSIRALKLDFLPRLRSAQANRCTYFAGAQVVSYDGQELTEAGFHLAPEGGVPTLAPVASGLLTANGVYKYRVDLCYRNAQNEEIRSNSFYTDEVTVGPVNRTVNVTIPTVLTRRSNAYFLIFRNESNGVQWYLCNSRDPSSAKFLVNDQSVATVAFVDNGDIVDAALIQQEQHPGNGGFGYLEAYASPACEVIASGRDRLWVAGGELQAGQIAPSRLFTPQEAPSFNAYVSIQVDRNTEPVTAIGFVGDVAVIFRRTQAYIQGGDGPDNSSQGQWESSRLAFSDVGAVGPEGLALISQGLFFQSPVGIRLISSGGGVQAVGQPVDSLSRVASLASAVVVAEDSEVRFYSRNGDCLVYNYQYDAWSTWTLRAVGATRNPASGLSIIATPDGFLFTEAEGVWTDNERPYRHRIRFSWLRAGSLMDFQSVRRVGAIGEWDGVTPHDVNVEVFYDEREFYEEKFSWSVPEDAEKPSWNKDNFGAGNFGDGTFGDTDTD